MRVLPWNQGGGGGGGGGGGQGEGQVQDLELASLKKKNKSRFASFLVCVCCHSPPHKPQGLVASSSPPLKEDTKLEGGAASSLLRPALSPSPRDDNDDDGSVPVPDLKQFPELCGAAKNCEDRTPLKSSLKKRPIVALEDSNGPPLSLQENDTVDVIDCRKRNVQWTDVALGMGLVHTREFEPSESSDSDDVDDDINQGIIFIWNPSKVLQKFKSSKILESHLLKQSSE